MADVMLEGHHDLCPTKKSVRHGCWCPIFKLVLQQDRQRIVDRLSAEIDSLGENVESEGRDWCNGALASLQGAIRVVEETC